MCSDGGFSIDLDILLDFCVRENILGRVTDHLVSSLKEVNYIQRNFVSNIWRLGKLVT